MFRQPLLTSDDPGTAGAVAGVPAKRRHAGSEWSERHSTDTDAREQDTDTREATMQDLKSVRHSTDTDTMEATMQGLNGA